MIPTDEQLRAAKLTRTDYERRNRIWNRCLSEMEPDSRDRIRSDPTGPDGMALALKVEIELGGVREFTDKPKKFEGLTLDDLYRCSTCGRSMAHFYGMGYMCEVCNGIDD